LVARPAGLVAGLGRPPGLAHGVFAHAPIVRPPEPTAVVTGRRCWRPRTPADTLPGWIRPPRRRRGATPRPPRPRPDTLPGWIRPPRRSRRPNPGPREHPNPSSPTTRR